MNTTNNDKLMFIFCAPLSEFKEPPKGNSLCKLVDCPDCGEKMWLSEKKEEMQKLFNKAVKMNCYDCFKKFAESNVDMFKDNQITCIDIS